MTNFYDEFEAYLKGEDSNITDSIIANDKGDAVERMAIYKDAYAMRLMDILYGDYPTIHEILGTETFFSMAKEYLEKYPSTSFTVRHFGQYLPKFLQEAAPYSDYPYLWQIADFEWAKGTVFDAPDTELFTIEELASIDPEEWENITFTFIPAMSRLIYDYNVPQIWQAVNDDTQESEPVMLQKSLPWVMWRKDLNPNWYSMSDDEDWFFIQARKGATFGELCEGLMQWIDDEEKIVVRAAAIVRRWIDEKMLVRLNIL
ncbi:MAG: putative DNA-binding domain-containing protein [Gammaproteobacteria bacterium]|nr:putative DNA-binding domain-containing protein [Gammaproteobacteria bacterium]